MSTFQQAKLALVDTAGLAKDALHIYVALIVFFLSCILFKWKARQWKPWLLVVLAALTGEALDIRDELAAAGPILWAESAKDIVNTLLVPTIILLAARYGRMFGKD